MLNLVIYIVHFGIIAYLSWRLYQTLKLEPLAKFYFPGLLLKIIAGIGLGLLYKIHYGYGDTIGFDADTINLVTHIKAYPSDYWRILFLSKSKYSYFITDYYPRFGGTYLFLKICTVFYLLTNNSYWITGIYLSFFSFLGMWTMANVLVKIFPKTQWEAAVAFLSFPSVIFWSTGVMKESVVEGSIGFIVAFFLALMRNYIKPKWYHWLCLPLLCYWLMKIKFYYFIVLFTVLLLGYVWRVSHGVHFVVKIVSVLLLLFGGSLFLHKIHPHLAPSKVTAVMVGNHNDNYGFCFERATGGSLDGKGVIMYDHFNNSASGFLLNVPNAWFSSLFRPLPAEASNIFQLIVSMGDVFVFILCLLCVQKMLLTSVNWEPEVTMCLIYTSVLGICMAFTSPNMGTLARYKVGYIPFFIYLVLSYSGIMQYFSLSRYLEKINILK